MTYSVTMYNRMIADRIRTNAYEQAMRAAIQPGAVVADIGTGSGYFAVLACQLGASRVYAIEPDTIVELARSVAADNGVADRIEFITGLSTNVTIPEKVDVIVSDLRGSLPFHEQMIPSMVDLRGRYLKAGGVLMPARDTVNAALIHSPEFYSVVTEASAGDPETPDLFATRKTLRSTRLTRKVRQEDCISEYRSLGSLDYLSVTSARFASTVCWKADSTAVAHGVCVWFDTTIFGSYGFSNAPSSADTVYGRSVFPFLEPLDLEPSDLTQLTFDAVLLGTEYVFRWETMVTSGRDGSVKTHFRQSTLDGTVLPREALRRKRDDHVPSILSDRGPLHFVLDRVDGISSLSEIATDLSRNFPGRFSDWKDALQFAAAAIERNR
jgi:protein arginine N-methyltransferase 1